MSQPSAIEYPIRICIVNEFFYPDSTGGTGTVLSDLARTLVTAHPQVKIDVITSRNLYRDREARLAPYEKWGDIAICRLATPHPGGSSTVKRLAINTAFSLLSLWTLLRRRKYDMVLVGTAPPTLAMTALLLKKLTGTPYAYVIYDLDPDRAVNMGVLKESSLVARVLRTAQKSWLHGAFKTIVLGRCMQEHLLDAYDLSFNKSAVIPIGADPDDIVPGPKQGNFRRDNELGGFVVSYSGNFGRYHNFDTILDAAKILARDGQNVTFVLAGGGAQKDHVADRVRTEHIDNVRLFPFVPKSDYCDSLAAADVSLVTLEPGMEGLCVPSKFYSILASGRPVIALVSPKSEVARVITEDCCGMQVEQGDTNGLVQAITYLATHRAEAERFGENARRTLETKYSTARIAQMYYDVMRPSSAAPERECDELPR